MIVPLDVLPPTVSLPAHVIVDHIAKAPGWSVLQTTLFSAGVGAVFGVGGNVLMEFIKPALEKSRKRKSTENNLVNEAMSNLRSLEACKLVLDEGDTQPLPVYSSTSIVGYLRELLGPMGTARYEHFFKENPSLVFEVDNDLLLQNFMQSCRTIKSMAANQLHPQFRERLSGCLQTGHAFLASKNRCFNPNGYPLNEVQPLLEETRRKRTENEATSENDGV